MAGFALVSPSHFQLCGRWPIVVGRGLVVLFSCFGLFSALLPDVSFAGEREGEVPGEYIVRFKQRGIENFIRQGPAKQAARLPRLAANAVSDIAAIKRAAVSQMGFRPVQDLRNIGSMLVRDDDSQRSAYDLLLAEDSDLIESIAANRYVDLLFTPNDTHYSLLWGLNSPADIDIDAPEAWDLADSSTDVVVAVVDTGGDYTHVDLRANHWANPGEVAGNSRDDDGNGVIDDVYGFNTVTGRAGQTGTFRGPGDPFDFNNYGHGTHVAGTIAAVGNNGRGVIGVAGPSRRVKVMSLRAFGDDGTGTLADVLTCIDYALMMKREFGINVVAINASYGHAGYLTEERSAIAEAISSGITFVAAAGNGGADQIGDNNDYSPLYPASYDLSGLISVAAVDRSGNRASFSNYGRTSVDIAGPGVEIASVTPANQYFPAGEHYHILSGTSMATPHVTGVAALVASHAPQFSPAQVRQAILSNVKPLSSLNGSLVAPGIVDLKKVLEGLVVPDTYRLSGRVLTTGGAGLSGVTINGGSLGARTTDASGNFSFEDIPARTAYDISPSKQGYQFSPASASGILSSDRSVTFTATSQTYTLSGYVRYNGVGLSGVTIKGGNLGNKVTNANGYYRFDSISNGTTYRIVAEKTGYSFTPSSTEGTVKASTRKDFEARKKVYRIAGYVKSNDKPLRGVFVDGGALGNRQTDSNGYYRFSSVTHGTRYTVRPAKAGYRFLPSYSSGYLTGDAHHSFTAVLR